MQPKGFQLRDVARRSRPRVSNRTIDLVWNTASPTHVVAEPSAASAAPRSAGTVG
jgi:hypothetical protein